MTGPVSRCHNDGNLALLSRLELLPPGSDGTAADTVALRELATASAGTAIERPLLELWSHWRRVAPKRQRKRATETAAWLRSVVDTGGGFTFGLPGDAGKRFAELCGPRVLFCPHGLPGRGLAAIATSRIGRGDTARSAFVTKLQHVTQRIAESGQAILAVEGTAGADLVIRAAQRAEIPRLRAHCESSSRPENWLPGLIRADMSRRLTESLLFVSPSPVEESLSEQRGDSVDSVSPRNFAGLPLRDRVTFALAESIWSLSVRKNGNHHALLQWRLMHNASAAGSVRFVRTIEEPIPEHVANLADQGAIVWQLLSPDASEIVGDATASHLSVSHPATEPASRITEVDHLRDDLLRDDEWLIHWTRAATRPHGSQTSKDWLDQQLDSISDNATGSLTTLQQILRDGRLRASSDALRGSRPMTCFSAVPLRELISRRRFQTHRARWDCEPYGLCIRRSTLAALGARPVIYGDDSLWQSLPEPERPWFQQRFSGRGERQIDWSEELEWRVAGDVRLDQFRRDDLVLFCKQRDDIAQLSPVCAWPMIALEDIV